MEPGGARTLCILRRMKRKSLGMWSLTGYDPTKARPEELRFHMLDERERVIGHLAYAKLGIRFMKLEDSFLSTPWGEGIISSSKEGVRILLNGRELFLMKGSLLRGGFSLLSPTGANMVFRPIKGGRNDMVYSDGSGYFSVSEEMGRLPAPPPGRPLELTKEEIRRLPKEERPRSVESLEYVQYRFRVSGILPVEEDDLVAALVMFASYGCLIGEIPT